VDDENFKGVHKVENFINALAQYLPAEFINTSVTREVKYYISMPDFK
jgi:hypothetical protein